MLRLFIWLLYSFVFLCPFVFAATTCHTDIIDGQPVETCTEDPKPSWETPKECPKWCCGIKLNTNFPIIWNCISLSEWQANPTNVFPAMMRALTRIIMSVILVVCFIMIIIAWIMRAWAGEDSSKKTAAKKIIERVAITILLLWFSWAILRLINPNFFG